MASSRASGAAFEDLACRYLEAKGYRILERNVFLNRKEVDIVAAARGTIVFIEVKGRRSARFGSAVEAVDQRKRQRLVRAATAYIKARGLWAAPCRFDVIGVEAAPGCKPVFEHLENAFQA
jgi:putative endonuclease